jgi:hypothetical protein
MNTITILQHNVSNTLLRFTRILQFLRYSRNILLNITEHSSLDIYDAEEWRKMIISAEGIVY